MNYGVLTSMALLLLFACSPKTQKEKDTTSPFSLIDPGATEETKALYQNLFNISKTNMLYGHQDDMAYGLGWWNIEGKSDVKDVCGSYPAVFGWELGNLGQERNLDSVLFSDIQKYIIKAYALGAINTISWHMTNPVSKKDSWDQTKAVYSILPGGSNHFDYKDQLQLFAKFLEPLKDSNGISIPIIFRPLHEHNGSWFWWGKNHCTRDEYIDLWKFTVHYLRDSLKIHNLIYAYSPDGQFSDYLDRYPGDDYVDILGVDYYFRKEIYEGQSGHFVTTLIELTKLARQKNKPAILSETGYESIPDPNWHTKSILNPVLENKEQIEIAYMLTWRNARKDHHYAPYPGHASVNDFMEFYNHPYTIFADGLKNMYSLDNMNK
jgi:mannan endo-1,4-beta-mannosidase